MNEPLSMPEQLESLYTQHYPLMYKLACNRLYAFTGSATDAEDVVQTVFLLAARKWSTLENHPRQAAWLAKATTLVCRNHARSHHRHAQKARRSMQELLGHQPAAYGKLYTGAAADGIPVQDDLISLEQRLAPDEFALLKAYCLEQRPIEELMAANGLSETALRVRICRIRKKVLEIFILAVIIVACQNI